MPNASSSLRLFAVGLAALLAGVAPAMAQAPGLDANLPTCSASVTDHCMQRGGSMHGGMAAMHHRAAKSRHHHRMMRHHHHWRHHKAHR